MVQQSIADLIREKFDFVKTPSEGEVTIILQRLSYETTEEEFFEIVYSVVEDTTSFAFESLDMSASKNILLQIKKAAGKTQNNGS